MNGPISTGNPFTCDGVQAISVYCPGWTGLATTVVATAREGERFVADYIREMLPFTDRIEFTYYGYDPCVYNTPDDPSSGILGTDGYPDWVGRYDPDTETVVWEQA